MSENWSRNSIPGREEQEVNTEQNDLTSTPLNDISMSDLQLPERFQLVSPIKSPVT